MKDFSKTFPVFYARYLHFYAYKKMLFSKRKTAAKFLDISIRFAEACGNLIDRQWASHSKKVWFGKVDKDDTNYWDSHYQNMPNWENVKIIDTVERSFVLKIAAK